MIVRKVVREKWGKGKRGMIVGGRYQEDKGGGGRGEEPGN